MRSPWLGADQDLRLQALSTLRHSIPEDSTGLLASQVDPGSEAERAATMQGLFRVGPSPHYCLSPWALCTLTVGFGNRWLLSEV